MKKSRLQEALRFNTPLAEDYYLKDLLYEFWECDEAEGFLEDWISKEQLSDNILNIKDLYNKH